MNVHKRAIAVAASLVAAMGVTVWGLAASTELDIGAHRSAVVKAATASPSSAPTGARL